MKKYSIHLLIICFLASYIEAFDVAKKPNIIFILADDLGWSDLNCYGNKFHETPNIDKLAQGGMRFTNYHTTSPVCSPTRASIITGLYTERLGMTQPACHIDLISLKAHLPKAASPKEKVVEPKSTTRLDTSLPSIAKKLQASGYRTGHFGKWHLGAPPYSPLEHGFDIDVPKWTGHGPNASYLGPKNYGPNFVTVKNEHIEDRMAQEAIAFIQQNKDKPFFLNYWAFSVHSPYVAKPALIEKYQRKAQSLAPDAPHRNPIYAAMIQSFDEAIGKLLTAVDEAGLSDQTIIIFTSDNGPQELSITDNGQEKWTNGSADLWSIPITSSAPLKGEKGSLHEGGTRVPCIVMWPNQIKPAKVSDAMFSSVDFFPTIMEMTGVSMSEKIDGISQLATLKGDAAPRQFLYGYWPNYPPERLKDKKVASPGAWVQHNGYKLVCYFCDGPDGKDRLELYNLDSDPGEQLNLADQKPELVATMRTYLKQHHENTGALIPFLNPNYLSNEAQQ